MIRFKLGPIFKSLLFIIFFSSNNFAHYPSANSKWKVEIKYVEPGKLAVFAEPSLESKAVGNLYYLDKVLVIIDPEAQDRFGWSRVVYPQNRLRETQTGYPLWK